MAKAEFKVKHALLDPVHSLEVSFVPGGEKASLCSNISWDNASAMRGLREMFHAKPDEQLASIEITEQGILARFVRIRD